MRFQKSRNLGGMDEDYSWLSGDNHKLSAPKIVVPPENLQTSECIWLILHNSCRCLLFRVNAGDSGLDSTFACRPGARDPRFAPPNRRASEVRRKAPKVDFRGPSVLDLSLPLRRDCS